MVSRIGSLVVETLEAYADKSWWVMIINTKKLSLISPLHTNGNRQGARKCAALAVRWHWIHINLVEDGLLCQTSFTLVFNFFFDIILSSQLGPETTQPPKKNPVPHPSKPITNTINSRTLIFITQTRAHKRHTQVELHDSSFHLIIQYIHHPHVNQQRPQDTDTPTK